MKKRNKIPIGVFLASILKLTHEGRGLAEIEGKKTFIRGALPGEQVNFEYTFNNRTRAEGRCLEVNNAHSQRTEPTCPHFDVCGGCELQHLEPEAVLSHKQAVLKEQFEYMAKVQPKHWLEPVTGPHWGYRKKARLGVRYVEKKGGCLVGFREKYSNRLAVMDECHVLDPKLGFRLSALKTLLTTLSIRESIPQIEVAITENDCALVVRHLEPFSDADLTAFCAFCKEYDFNLYLQPKGVDSVKKHYPDDGKDLLSYRLDEQDLTFEFHPMDFTQVNPVINQKMVTLALSQLDLKLDDKVLDLFCGLGNFTLPLAQKAAQVLGIEGSQSAVERARHNAQLNGLSQVEFKEQNLFELETKPFWVQPYDKVLIDPPRSGAAQALPWVAECRPTKILYVSCNPATLARDAKALVHEHGYELDTLCVLDMFAHTAHVESMALFTLKG